MSMFGLWLWVFWLEYSFRGTIINSTESIMSDTTDGRQRLVLDNSNEYPLKTSSSVTRLPKVKILTEVCTVWPGFSNRTGKENCGAWDVHKA
jgi:hypothetical protein